MRIFQHFLLTAFFGICLYVSASGQVLETPLVRYRDIHQALDNPSGITRLELKSAGFELQQFQKRVREFKNLRELKVIGSLQFETSERLFQDLSQLPQLETLTLQNNSLVKTPKSLGQLKKLNKITLDGSPDLEVKMFFKRLTELPHLKELTFRNNEFFNVPKEIKDLNALEILHISGNKYFNYVQAIRRLSEVKNLKTLAMPSDELAKIPASIGELQQLEVLDLRNNMITELPVEISQLKKLRVLRLAGNLIVDPMEELAKVKALPLEFYSIDDHELTAADRKKLARMFDDAQLASEEADIDNLYASYEQIEVMQSDQLPEQNLAMAEEVETESKPEPQTKPIQPTVSKEEKPRKETTISIKQESRPPSEEVAFESEKYFKERDKAYQKNLKVGLSR